METASMPKAAALRAVPLTNVVVTVNLGVRKQKTRNNIGKKGKVIECQRTQSGKKGFARRKGRR
jgi:hypothetical protein